MTNADDLAVIGVLEGLAGELACSSASDDELQAIADLNDRMAASINPLDPLALFSVDTAFHRAIVEAAGNPSLEKPIVSIMRGFGARASFRPNANHAATTSDGCINGSPMHS